MIEWVSRLSAGRVLVLGDVCLDRYMIGRAERLSREAPVPVIEIFEEREIPGAAANPAVNVAALHGEAMLVSVIGGDDDSARFVIALQNHGIDNRGLVVAHERPTTTKSRLMARSGLRFPQQIARIDRITREPISNNQVEAILQRVRMLAKDVRAILVSDYRAGLLTPGLVKSIRVMGRARELLLTADAQGELDKYAGFDLVKCNADEARAYLGEDLRTDEDFAEAGRRMLKKLALRGGALITRGRDGMTLVTAEPLPPDPVPFYPQRKEPEEPTEEDAPSSSEITQVSGGGRKWFEIPLESTIKSVGRITHIPAANVTDVYDVTGAGDTVIAVATLALSVGAPYVIAAALANVAAGIVVQRVGNYAPTPDELRAALEAVR